MVAKAKDFVCRADKEWLGAVATGLARNHRLLGLRGHLSSDGLLMEECAPGTMLSRANVCLLWWCRGLEHCRLHAVAAVGQEATVNHRRLAAHDGLCGDGIDLVPSEVDDWQPFGRGEAEAGSGGSRAV